MTRIAIIGAGNMGSAIAKRIEKKYRIIVSDIDPNKLRKLNIRDNVKAVRGADIIILAVKPQNMDAVLDEIKGVNKLVISIAAGIKTRKIEEKLGRVPVIRVMPNTPLLAGMGMSALCRGRYAGLRHIRIADRIFSSMGKVILVKEKQMDAVTAISGSGPAYVYLFIESLIKSAIGLGLSKDMVIQTLKGALGLLEKTGKSPEELRKQVTSPGGTTEAALKVFQREGFTRIIDKAIRAACKRSRELSR